jgi:hypothetical protein
MSNKQNVEIQKSINLINKVISDLKKLRRKDILIDPDFIETLINMYLQINLRRMIELLESISVNVKNKLKLPSMLSARAILETVAIFAAFKNEFEKVNLENYDQVQRLIDVYVRKTRNTEYLEIFTLEDQKHYRSTNIQTLIEKKLNSINLDALKDYEILSNKCHPNFEGFFNLYAFGNENNGLIEFQSSSITERSNNEISLAIEITAKYGGIFCSLHDDISYLTNKSKNEE